MLGGAAGHSSRMRCTPIPCIVCWPSPAGVIIFNVANLLLVAAIDNLQPRRVDRGHC
jgi:hypothetical protein